MSTRFLRYANLSDSYERKARLAPAVLALAPLLPLLAICQWKDGDWLTGMLSGLGIWTALGVGLSHVASALGNRFQAQLWPTWPHDAPTHRRLHPKNDELSTQQKRLLWQTIKDLTGLDIEAAAEQGDVAELDRVINDAVTTLQSRLWQTHEGRRVDLHNADYGFARNLAGLRTIWVPLAVGSMIVLWIGYMCHSCSLVGPVAYTLFAAAAIVFAYCILPGYVRKKANDYADSFLAALPALRDRK